MSYVLLEIMFFVLVILFIRPALPVPNTSVSEGEVPLSPGDVRWHSLFSKTIGSGKHPHVDPTIEAFLDLKNSPDPSLSDSQDSQPSESKVALTSIVYIKL